MALTAAGDIEIVRSTRTERHLADILRTEQPDVVVLVAELPDMTVPSAHMLDGRSSPKVLPVSPDARHASLYELAPRVTPLVEVTTTALIRVTRTAARGPM